MKFAGFDLVEKRTDSYRSRENGAESSPWLILLVLVPFFALGLWIAKSLAVGIAPDEPAHYLFIKHYATTIGFPQDTLQTMRTGWYVQQNPFLYYWLNARFYAAARLFNPNLTDGQGLMLMRSLSVIYSTGSLYFLYQTARLLFQKAWQQLLPPFLLANTLMFTFLSGAVSYDNLANLFAAAAIYFLVRLIKGGNYLRYSLLFILTLLWGNLVKYPMTPLAFIGVIVWLYWSIKHRKYSKPQKIGLLNSALIILIAIALVFNASIYGQNLIRYRALTPGCIQLYEPQQCALSPYQQRWEALGVKDKPTLIESIRAGGPNPLTYFFRDWIDLMLTSIYGILAHISYDPTQVIPLFRLFFLVILLLGFRFTQKLPSPFGALLLIMIFYAGILFSQNINTELTFNYLHIGGLQGRYLFPVIGIAYLLITQVLGSLPKGWFQNIALFATLVLFVYSGPLKFALYWSNLFKDWFSQ